MANSLIQQLASTVTHTNEQSRSARGTVAPTPSD
jgi:hypothetical protein